VDAIADFLGVCRAKLFTRGSGGTRRASIAGIARRQQFTRRHETKQSQAARVPSELLGGMLARQ
jgi:hypothetical protein